MFLMCLIPRMIELLIWMKNDSMHINNGDMVKIDVDDIEDEVFY